MVPQVSGNTWLGTFSCRSEYKWLNLHYRRKLGTRNSMSSTYRNCRDSYCEKNLYFWCWRSNPHQACCHIWPHLAMRCSFPFVTTHDASPHIIHHPPYAECCTLRWILRVFSLAILSSHDQICPSQINKTVVRLSGYATSYFGECTPTSAIICFQYNSCGAATLACSLQWSRPAFARFKWWLSALHY